MRRPLILALTGMLAAGLSPAVAIAGPEGGPAPGAPGAHPLWLPAGKTGFGGARDQASNVWFTLHSGQMSDVYYPDLSTPSIRSLAFVVTDGESFAATDADAKFEQVRRQDGLTYEQTITDDRKRWKLRKTYVTDPKRASVLVDVDFTSLTGKPYQLYAVLDPDLANNGTDDTAKTEGDALVATDGEVTSALAANPAFTKTSNGFSGTSDGATQLLESYQLKSYDSAGKGNVVQTGQLAADGVKSRKATLSLGFGEKAADTAKASLKTGFGPARKANEAGWRDYLRGLKKTPASVAGDRDLYEASMLMLAASEDKQNPGAFIASPSMPWQFGDNGPGWLPSGTYHLVWPRDLYQIATGMLAAGDEGAAHRSIEYMFTRQQQPDGHLAQNTDVDGTPYWTSVQLDETALPIVLAQQVGIPEELWPNIRRAADFLIDYRGPNGQASPWSQQERWEEQDGYSPSTIASVIAGLVCAAELAKEHGDAASAERYLAKADEFKGKLAGWTVTTNGPLSDDPYFVRLTKDGNADNGTVYNLGNSSYDADQRAVADAGFLELVRLGIYAPDDPVIRNSLDVVDKEISYTTPTGQFWHRYTGDGYGEKADGSQWEMELPPGSRQTFGRLWPLLAGERGEYELANGEPAAAKRRLRDLGRVAGTGDTMPEQVWDEHAPSGQPGFPTGKGNQSATPLAWTHAQFVRLAWSVQEGKVIEQPAVVRCRYLGSC
ncbi:glycoside hydrolase family 15 protein [Amycolatopsis albispora]|uniref:Glucan 1,4-alpha-glucosidase n=1 Tax=Amycolatopsis albispora TaxID=1804986 RepID=A0A344LBW5_9PSEU|nr:glycoside hydrolase family 15 protein [Amycolatopsis albispora]AXB45539.1 glucan 1,4-alpha-glucosidase [Amycolatopsis albispora]